MDHTGRGRVYHVNRSEGVTLRKRTHQSDQTGHFRGCQGQRRTHHAGGALSQTRVQWGSAAHAEVACHARCVVEETEKRDNGTHLQDEDEDCDEADEPILVGVFRHPNYVVNHGARKEERELDASVRDARGGDARQR